MREPIYGTVVDDDLYLAVEGHNISLDLLAAHGPVPMVKVMLAYYQELITSLLLRGMSFGL